MTYMELLNLSVKGVSRGAVQLVSVPEHLRISEQNLVGLSYTMDDRIRANTLARDNSFKHVK